MFRFACRDVGIDCDYVVTAATVDEVMKNAGQHAAVAHADLHRGISETEKDQLRKQVLASIKPVSAMSA